MTPIVSLEAARAYLRLDSTYEDALVSSLLLSAQALCMDVARLSSDEWEALMGYEADGQTTYEEGSSPGEEDFSPGEDESSTAGESSAEEAAPLVIRGEEKTRDDVVQIKDLLRIGVLYALGYLYEHREEADHHGLTLTLRSLLFSIREGVV